MSSVISNQYPAKKPTNQWSDKVSNMSNLIRICNLTCHIQTMTYDYNSGK